MQKVESSAAEKLNTNNEEITNSNNKVGLLASKAQKYKQEKVYIYIYMKNLVAFSSVPFLSFKCLSLKRSDGYAPRLSVCVCVCVETVGG